MFLCFYQTCLLHVILRDSWSCEDVEIDVEIELQDLAMFTDKRLRERTFTHAMSNLRASPCEDATLNLPKSCQTCAFTGKETH